MDQVAKRPDISGRGYVVHFLSSDPIRRRGEDRKEEAVCHSDLRYEFTPRTGDNKQAIR